MKKIYKKRKIITELVLLLSHPDFHESYLFFISEPNVLGTTDVQSCWSWSDTSVTDKAIYINKRRKQSRNISKGDSRIQWYMLTTFILLLCITYENIYQQYFFQCIMVATFHFIIWYYNTTVIAYNNTDIKKVCISTSSQCQVTLSCADLKLSVFVIRKPLSYSNIR